MTIPTHTYRVRSKGEPEWETIEAQTPYLAAHKFVKMFCMPYSGCYLIEVVTRDRGQTVRKDFEVNVSVGNCR